MKASLVVLAAAGLVAAQDFSGQPDCALPCLKDAIPQVGCALDDPACACAADAQRKLVGIVGPCLLKACQPQEVVQAQQAAAKACAALSESGSPATSASETSAASESSGSVPTTAVTDTFTTTAGDSTVTGTATNAQTTGTDGTPTPTPTGADGEGAAGRGPVAGLLAALIAFAVAL
jgi:hypothetical protein